MMYLAGRTNPYPSGSVDPGLSSRVNDQLMPATPVAQSIELPDAASEKNNYELCSKKNDCTPTGVVEKSSRCLKKLLITALMMMIPLCKMNTE